LQTPEYIKNFNTNKEDFYITRGRTSMAFQKGLDAIENKNWDEAIKSLNEDIASNSGESSIFYSHYVLGLTYLRSADSDFLGLFKSFDEEKVKSAVYNLEKTIELNTSGNFYNINLDANYYLGRAYLLLEDYAEAKTHLQYVVNEKGGLYKDAEELLNSIPE
jgi:tetratricopeptide (TPR) repeat protein